LAETSDFLVVGSGIAGLSFALRAAEHGTVTILTKKERADSNTNHAQGGIAAVVDPADSFASHVRDTLTAGVGLNRPEAVELLVREGPESVRELETWGVRFTAGGGGGLDLGREGGHSFNRIVHAKDSTGMAVEQALLERVRNHPRIRVFENHIGVEIITQHHLQGLRKTAGERTRAWGVYALDIDRGKVAAHLADVTLLSTGGAGRVYLHTTNPTIATGDGVSMAFRAGAAIADLEFMQFHPTALFHPDGDSFLISEAVRGFGGILRTADGEAFMKRYHPLADLAPRDIVARAIDAEMKKRGDDSVFLDVTHCDRDAVREHFPHIYEKLLSLKIDMTREPVPVVPAAHYMCGGVLTDLNGQSSIEGLYVTGEAACTGVHGANRLASNSLLEAVVFSRQAFRSVMRNRTGATRRRIPDFPAWDDSGTFDQEEWVLISHDQREIRRLMWDYVGIVRSDERLDRAERRIGLIAGEIESFYKKTTVTSSLLELRNISCMAMLIIRSALFRKESRGLHCNTDYPERDDTRWLGQTVIEENRTFFWPLSQVVRF
jgi:L-aspartate oxidase